MTSFQKKNPNPATQAEEKRTGTQKYLRDFVYGAIDGTVTTFAVVTSVAGAGLKTEIVIVLGLANLIGDGFSMAAGNYLGTKTDQQVRQKLESRSSAGKNLNGGDDGSRLVKLLTDAGVPRLKAVPLLQKIVADVGRQSPQPTDKSSENHSALTAAVTTFGAFVIVGLLPLVAFMFGAFVSPVAPSYLYLSSLVMTALAFFMVGTAKSYFVDQKWYWSGFETLTIGGIAASLAYAVGMSLKAYAGTP